MARFYVLRTVLPPMERCDELSLADATHQLNCSGYALWHYLLADESELGRSLFYIQFTMCKGYTP